MLTFYKRRSKSENMPTALQYAFIDHHQGSNNKQQQQQQQE